jgi:hypothetical protein
MMAAARITIVHLRSDGSISEFGATSRVAA